MQVAVEYRGMPRNAAATGVLEAFGTPQGSKLRGLCWRNEIIAMLQRISHCLRVSYAHFQAFRFQLIQAQCLESHNGVVPFAFLKAVSVMPEPS